MMVDDVQESYFCSKRKPTEVQFDALSLDVSIHDRNVNANVE